VTCSPGEEMYGWSDGRMDRWVDGRMDRSMDSGVQLVEAMEAIASVHQPKGAPEGAPPR